MNLELKINSLYYDDEVIDLKNLKINLIKNGFLLIKGNTGSGKTTLLKVFCGLIPFVQKAKFNGYVKIDGKIRGFNFLRKISSICSQEPEVQFIMSNIENEITLNLNTKEKRKAYELLSLFNLEGLKNKSVKDLSTGQRKIVSLIPVLASNKKIKLFDEPTANLDLENKNKLKLIFKELKKENILVISSHDNCFEDLADKTTYLGQKVQKIKINTKFNRIKGEKIISLKDISIVSPDNFFSLEKISFNIFAGDIFGIFGPNGSGKTAIINLISKKIKQTGGILNIKKNLNISLVMQEPEKQLFTNSVLEEVMFSANLNEKEALNLIKKCGLGSEIDKHPFFLSRGQKQLLLIIAVLSSKPQVIIFDELLTGIDRENSIKIISIIKEYYNKNNPTIILTDQEDSIFRNIISGQINLEERRLDKYSEGLVHEIYRNDNLIFKKVKDNFKEFKNKEHFILEKKILNLLTKKNLPSVNIKGIEKISEDYYLIEEFVKGYQKEKGKLSYNEIKEILNFVGQVHKIKIKGYGLISSDLNGNFNSWKNFILSNVSKNIDYLSCNGLISKKKLKLIKITISKNLEILDYKKRGSLVITDLNPLNFFFRNEKLVGVIDIDHPLSGDPLYEYGALKWYHEDIFSYLIRSKNFSLKEFNKVLLYELIHGISVLSWMHKNNLKIEENVKKLINKVDNLRLN